MLAPSSSTPQIIRKGNVMKTLSLALLLMASIAFVLLGCSDNSSPLVSPTDQFSQAPASLGKSNDVSSWFSLSLPKEFLGGEMWIAGGMLQIKKFKVREVVLAGDPRVAGKMTNYLSLTVDNATGEGPCEGSFTIDETDPAYTGGGIWEGTYHGYRSKTDNPYVFTLPIKGVAHGKGGTVDKMQLFLTITLTVYTSLPDVPRPPIPPQAPIHWEGTGLGTVKEH